MRAGGVDKDRTVRQQRQLARTDHVIRLGGGWRLHGDDWAIAQQLVQRDAAHTQCSRPFCSQIGVIDPYVRIQRYQPPDHPIRLQFREGRYLKFYVLQSV